MHILGLDIEHMAAFSHLCKRDDVARPIIYPFTIVRQAVEIMIERLFQIIERG